MINIINKLTAYDCGVLYGDGFYNEKDKNYTFTTTLSDLNEKMRLKFKSWNLGYSYKLETHRSEDKENWEDLHIYKFKNINGDELKNHLNYSLNNLTLGFVLGYIETKGSLFRYFEVSKNKSGKERWRLSLSGDRKDLEKIVIFLSKLDNEIIFSNVYRRVDKKRELNGVISESFRVHINRRNGILSLINKFEMEDLDFNLTLYLKNKIEGFKEYNLKNPFNRKTNVFKTYRKAGMYLARELGLEVKGERGGRGGGSGSKPIYVWENGKKVKEIGSGWEAAYDYLKLEYESKNEYEAPKVVEDLSK